MVFCILPSSPQFALASDTPTISRCKKYVPTIIRESHYKLGMDAPYWNFAGQIQQESRCNEGITAFDGGEGLGQFMPATAQDLQDHNADLKSLGALPMPYNPQWAIRALIIYDKNCYDKASCKDWYFAFRAYNGGYGTLNKEIARSKSCVPSIVEKFCKRKVVVVKVGETLDLCKVNTSYPVIIFENSLNYKEH